MALDDIERLVGREAYIETLNGYRSRAEQGDARAQALLGHTYSDGRLVEEDQEMAVLWWRRSAEQGDALGARRLGQAYLYGKGVEQDPVQAYKWVSLGAVRLRDIDDEFSEALFAIRDDLAKEMSPAQLDESRRKIREQLAFRH